jgi:hypothetical protein
MQSNLAGRVVLGIAVVVAAVVLLIVLGDGDGDDGAVGSKKASIPTIVVMNGKPVGGVEELVFDAGERIRFEVDSDVTDEVHVHGYDLSKDVEADGTVRFDFAAAIEGIFEVELEGRGEQIAELRIEP